MNNKRLIFLFSGLSDLLLGGIALLIYFNLLPIDVSAWGIPHLVYGVVGGVFCLFGVVVFAYTLTTSQHEP